MSSHATTSKTRHQTKDQMPPPPSLYSTTNTIQGAIPESLRILAKSIRAREPPYRYLDDGIGPEIPSGGMRSGHRGMKGKWIVIGLFSTFSGFIIIAAICLLLERRRKRRILRCQRLVSEERSRREKLQTAWPRSSCFRKDSSASPPRRAGCISKFSRDSEIVHPDAVYRREGSIPVKEEYIGF